VQRHGRDDPGPVVRVFDAGDERRPGGVDAHRDVTADVQADVDILQATEDVEGAFDRPSLDQPRRVEPAGQVDVEPAVGTDARLLAEREHLAHLRRHLLEVQVATAQAGDLAVVAIRAEGRVDVPQHPVGGGDHLVDALERVAAKEHAGRHAHHVLDEGALHDRCAASMADCSDSR
jgi:hypothetical protein